MIARSEVSPADGNGPVADGTSVRTGEHPRIIPNPVPPPASEGGGGLPRTLAMTPAAATRLAYDRQFAASLTERAVRGVEAVMRGTDMERQQFKRAIYEDPDPSPAWLHPYYICGCGFECVRTWGEPLNFVRVPHKCRLR